MKQFKILVWAAITLLIFACEKDKPATPPLPPNPNDTSTLLPSLTTLETTNIGATKVTTGGNISGEGSSAVTLRGVCWSTAPNPTVADDTTENGNGIGIFSVNIESLTANTTYYVRAYAVNSAGTAYGNQISFKTAVAANAKSYLNPDLTYGTLTDIDGNVYATIQIGEQTWMAENLRTTKFNDGEEIVNVVTERAWTAASDAFIPAWCYYDDNPANDAIYGKLYNGHTVLWNNQNRICPKGWHLPNARDWTQLQNYLYDGVSSFYETGTQIKSTALWLNSPAGATNSSGFTALPGGIRSDKFERIGEWAIWWSSDEAYYDPETFKIYISSELLSYDSNDLSHLGPSDLFPFDISMGGLNPSIGAPCRCLKDE